MKTAATVNIYNTLGTTKSILRLGNKRIRGSTRIETLAKTNPTARRVTERQLQRNSSCQPPSITQSEGRTQGATRLNIGVQALKTT